MTTPAEIFANLKRNAPNVAFSVARTPDPHFVWDGEGPDPAEEGYVAYDVDVLARAIVDGELVEGRASMGGHYDMPGEFDPDIAGYLPEMLQEAADELRASVKGPIEVQAAEAVLYLDQVMRTRYEERRGRPFRRKRWKPE